MKNLGISFLFSFLHFSFSNFNIMDPEEEIADDDVPDLESIIGDLEIRDGDFQEPAEQLIENLLNELPPDVMSGEVARSMGLVVPPVISKELVLYRAFNTGGCIPIDFSGQREKILPEKIYRNPLYTEDHRDDVTAKREDVVKDD